jgi:hypothetical protein
MLSLKWFRPERRRARRAAPCCAPCHALAASASAPAPRPRPPHRPSRTFPRHMRPEAPLFLPTPRVARRPRSLAPTDAAVVLQPHLRRHRVITGERAPYLRSFTPLTRAPSHRYSSRSTASAIDGRPVNLPSAFTPCFRHVPISS